MRKLGGSRITYFAFTFLIFFFATPRVMLAIPPPDIIANVGSQFAQVFSLLAVIFSVAVGAIVQVIHRMFPQITRKKFAWGLLGCVIVLLALILAAFLESRRAELFQQQLDKEITETIQQGIDEHDSIDEPLDESAFFASQRDLSLAINNEEFEAREQNDVFVLDAREDEEYAIGRYPGARHIRFADLLDGAWQELPTDRVVYVVCWSGIRGSEVAKFLRDKKIVAQYLEEGADGWVEYGGTWEGELAFSSKYSAVRYTTTLTANEVHAAVDRGVVLVDARQAEAYAESHIDGSINISVIFTPTVDLQPALEQVPANSEVITICNDFVSCFDAKIVGIKLENLGHVFLGRYATPWDY